MHTQTISIPIESYVKKENKTYEIADVIIVK
jgi:hypothetical protein